jgi:hypothetical protein
MENMFLDWLQSQGVELEAFTFRAPRDWCADQYIFRFRHSGGEWSAAHIIAWDIDTFVQAKAIIEGAA